MTARGSDPYQILGVSPRISDAELRNAYRRLVMIHHPDHNAGSEESERRFEEIQAAYAQIRDLRAGGRGAPPPPPPTGSDSGADARLEDLERQLREARLARERAQRAAREAAADTRGRASDEALGYVTTDDSLSKILADARDELAGWLDRARRRR